MSLKTALYNEHVALNARMVPFAGHLMPVSYSKGLQFEHDAVRNRIGIFDVSHMGEFWITGDNAFEFLQKMTVNDISKLNVGDAQYSAMCYENGGIVDDLILYRKPDGYFMVVNASNVDKNLKWLQSHLISDVKIENQSDQYSLIAIQGPDSRNFLSKFSDIDLDLKFYSYKLATVFGKSVMLSRTGYSGELGFEIYTDHDSIIEIWKQCMTEGIVPCGLAVRDVLRLEMNYCLYGNDIDQFTNTIEAGLKWITALDKPDFVGKTVLEKTYIQKPHKKLITFIMEERGIPRNDYDVMVNEEVVGKVTSGTQSMSLKNGIGMAYVQSEYSKSGQEIQIIIRNKFIKARIVKPPLVKGTSLLN